MAKKVKSDTSVSFRVTNAAGVVVGYFNTIKLSASAARNLTADKVAQTLQHSTFEKVDAPSSASVSELFG